MSNDATGASQFSLDGSTPSQFTMPGGGIPQYQGTQMMPATLGGVQGVQDAQDWTEAVNNSGSGVDWNAIGAAAGKLDQPETPGAPRGGAGGGRGGSVDFNPQQLNMQAQAAGAMPQGQGAGTLQTNLLQLLAQGNKGFALR